MKKIAALLFLVPTVLNAVDLDPPLPFKTVRIRYEFKQQTKDPSSGRSMFKSKGNEIRYIDAKNNRRRIERQRMRSIGGEELEELSIEIHDEKKTIILDPQFQSGRLFEVASSPEKAWAYRIEEGAKVLREEKVKGKPCKVYDRDGTKVWVWEGLLLKQEMKNDTFSYVLKATKIEENVSFSDDLFSVPGGYDVMKVDSPEINLPPPLFD